jgi:hypothetical protein
MMPASAIKTPEEQCRLVAHLGLGLMSDPSPQGAAEQTSASDY